MEKRSGSITAALLVGAGLMLHGFAGPGPSGASKHAEMGSSSRENAEREGPWKASCQYWEALRQNRPKTSATPASDSQVDGSNPPGSECSATEWGLPDNIGQLRQHGLQAHAVIATVPDPVHSHLAPEFDRAMDALVGAASDNRYLRSYAWLPWKALKEDASAATDSDDHASEEPGLLVFDQRSTSGETPIVLYMFLVAEMPGDGLNAGQLKKALTYELELRSALGAEFATDHAGKLRVIGPQYSGSAMSLIETVNGVLTEAWNDPSLKPRPGLAPKVMMAGSTETDQAYRILNRCPSAPGTGCEPGTKDVWYFSFASGNAVRGLLALLDENGYDRMRSVVLREDGTFFGAVSGAVSAKVERVQSIAFPRDISLLRNSQKESAGGGAFDAGAPSPYLHLTTHDEGSQDTLPDLSKDVTPLSQEAQLMSISHMLTQLHADFAYITASNPMDTLFLAKSLHRSNPDTRLVVEPDLLLQREGDDQPYIGSLSVTPYPLVWLARSAELPGRLRAFASGQMEALYNAASFTVGEMATEAPGPPHLPILYGYRGESSTDGTPSTSTAPKLWLATAGNDGYYPIAMLNTASGLPAEPQAKAETAITIHPSHVWQALCVLVGLACLLHIVALCSASYASPQTCDLDIRENCMQHRRALYGQVGGAALFLLSVALALPAGPFVGRHAVARLDQTNLVFALVILLLAISEWVVAIAKTFRAVRWESDDTSSLFQQSEIRVCAVLYWGSILATLGLAAMWLMLCVRSGGGQRLGAFFSYRCLHPLSGVSPLAPAVLLLWGWFFWALLHAKR
ncbi:MAG: hypothetical protein JWM54_2217, partial [Acidobacteriaceae bacterium]|nr:hypothetical protein [Acidobacteriaceae bacterium]